MGDDWKVGKERKKGIKDEIEDAIIIGVVSRNQTLEQITEYLDELEFLAETAGANTVKRYTQKLDHPDKRTFVGKGKIEEITQYVEDNENIALAIFDDDLTGGYEGFGHT